MRQHRSFYDDLASSQNPAIRRQLDAIYGELFPGRTVIRAQSDPSLSFQRSGRDVRLVVRRPAGDHGQRAMEQTIEEKIRDPATSHFPDLCIEYLSNAERRTVGWIYTSQADWLSYVRQFPDGLNVLILPLPAFRAWFELNWQSYQDLKPAPTTSIGAGYYTSPCKLIPLTDRAFQAFRAAHGSLEWPKRDGAFASQQRRFW